MTCELCGSKPSSCECTQTDYATTDIAGSAREIATELRALRDEVITPLEEDLAALHKLSGDEG